MQGEEGEQKPNNSQNRKILSDWLEERHSKLLTVLLPFARNVGSALGTSTEEIARELLVEATRRALVKAADYDATRSPKVWLLGIAHNVLLEWKDREIKWRGRHKNSLSMESGAGEEQEDPIARLFAAVGPDTETKVVGKFWAEAMLHQAPKPHREIIKTFMEMEFASEATAARLGLTSVNTRQRLNRARKWFRENMDAAQGSLTQGGRP